MSQALQRSGYLGSERKLPPLPSTHQVAAWAYAHLVDNAVGEWWGYADRAGAVTHRFKGGPYKGCFHVPRALLYVDRALSAALGEGSDAV